MVKMGRGEGTGSERDFTERCCVCCIAFAASLLQGLLPDKHEEGKGCIEGRVSAEEQLGCDKLD